MAAFNYLLSYNPLSTEVNIQRLQIFISQNRDIESWYLPFSGTFVIKSNIALIDLNRQFMFFFGTNAYILTYMVPNYSGGSLQPEAWHWINALGNPALGSD